MKQPQIHDTQSTRESATPHNPRRETGVQQTGWATVFHGGPIIALLLLVVYLSIASPYFASLGNAQNVSRQNAHLVILAVGQTMVIIGAGIDLSVGAVMAVSACVTAVLATQQVTILGATVGPLNVWVTIVIGLAVGVFVGFLNGVIITKGRIPDFIATLGMMEVARGVALLVTGGLPIPSHLTATELQGYLPGQLIWLGGRDILGIPTGTVIALGIVVIGWVIMSHTGLGRSIYALGGNKEAARVSGINVDRTKIATYTIMGLLAAIAGLVLTGRMNSANALMGSGAELISIAAVVIGGTNLFGGEGGVVGSLMGAVIMGILGNGLNLLNVSAFWQRVTMGVVIIMVVLFDQWRRRKFGG